MVELDSTTRVERGSTADEQEMGWLYWILLAGDFSFQDQNNGGGHHVEEFHYIFLHGEERRGGEGGGGEDMRRAEYIECT